MRRSKYVVAAILAGVVAAAGSASAQETGSWNFGLGGGVAIPTGTFSDVFNTGFDSEVYADYGVASAFSVGIHVGGNFHGAKKEFEDDLNALTEAFLIGAGATTARSELDVSASIIRFGLHGKSMPQTANYRPFIQGGGGAYRLSIKIKGDVTADGQTEKIDESDDETKFGLHGGAGVMFTASPTVSIGVRGQYHHVFTEGDATQFFSVAAAVDFGGGGR